MRIFRRIIPPIIILLGAFAACAEPLPKTLPPRSPGELDIHQISTGRGNAALLVFPDGTTLVIDTGDAGPANALATAFPDDSRGAGEWVARYIKRVAGDSALIDYAIATHFH